MARNKKTLFVLGLLLFLGFVLSACGEDSEKTSNQLTVTTSLRGEEVETVQIECGANCLQALDNVDLEPVPRDAFCTRIYGGPEEVYLSGLIDGEKIDARFNKTGGCEIARFNTLGPLLKVLELKEDQFFPGKDSRPL